MGYTQATEMANLMDLELGIRWQLLHNHYPPVPNVMIPIAVRAIELFRDEQYTKTIKTPFEHRTHDCHIPAHVIVDAYHLEPWGALF
jgi:hypothetical protein